MPHDESINEEHTGRDVTRMTSTLEDIDFALYKFFDENLQLKTNTNKGFRKTPIVWAGSERAHNVKNDDLNRDVRGQIVLPIISIERTAVKKTERSKVIPYAAVDPRDDIKGGYLTINKVIKQDKTSNFANADAFRRTKQLNYPLYRKKENKKIVYETLTIPIPIYVEVEYNIVLRTEYQEQMNDLLVPIIRSSNAHKRIIVRHNSNVYEAFFDENYNMDNNISNYDTNERKYETTIAVNVFGYLIGDGENQEQPRVVRRENAVQIRFARERILVGDPDYEDGKFRF
tara:strand:- start:12655 stop:13515 length:861 start_codon:yes stop_codon:yes gene_type:complete